MVVDLSVLSDIEIVGLTIYGESRGEPIEGQIAVANVIKNRLRAQPSKYKNYANVCLEKLQFSCWNQGDPNRAVLEEIAAKMITGQTPVDSTLRQCLFIAKGIISWDVLDNTKGAMNYLTEQLFSSPDRPNWAKNPKNVMFTGRQVFFNV